MQASQANSHKNHENSRIDKPPPQRTSFSPFVANTLQFKGNSGISPGALSYNEKHNLIIASPRDNSLQFYDATTLKPLEETEAQQLDTSALEISFCSENNTCLLGCSYGSVYAYDISNKTLQKMRKFLHAEVIAASFTSSVHYVFSSYSSKELFVGNLENGELLRMNSGTNTAFSLKSLPREKLLLSGLANGSMRIYGVDRLPRLPVLYSVQGSQYGRMPKVENITMNGKEYILTSGNDFKIRMWHLIKGKMRLLRVISAQEQAFRMIYLENYKMLVTTHNTREIKFWNLKSGRLEKGLDLNLKNCQGMFLMKDKNAIGVASMFSNQIRIVPLE